MHDKHPRDGQAHPSGSDGYARWNGPLIAAALSDVDVQDVWRFLRAQKIDLSARKSWCESNDPDFAAKAAEIVGFILIRRRTRSFSP